MRYPSFVFCFVFVFFHFVICACFCGNISKEKIFDMHCANISSPECVICTIRCRVLPLAKHVDRRIYIYII